MIAFSRNSRSALAKWWWTVDKGLLAALAVIVVIGVLLSLSASPAVASRIGVGKFHFVIKQMFFLPFAIGLMLCLSMLGLKEIRRIAMGSYVFFILLVIATLFVGDVTKGASRWINLLGFSLQPSEFVKPAFIVVCACLFEGNKKYRDFPGNILALVLFLFTILLLLKQPDFGMTLLISAIWGLQAFLAGLPIVWVAVLGGIGLIGVGAAYYLLPHVHQRLLSFFAAGDNDVGYQVKKSLEAFRNGDLFGMGPGEGIVKDYIPDAHTDFIFAVAAEEYGMLLCVVIVALYAFVVIRSMIVSCKDNNLFIILSATGLAASFGLQGIINMASTLHIGPTKGMTLPFISYGGSSLLATALCLGMLLAITRKNVHAEEKDESN